jgi:hypothetical protein
MQGRETLMGEDQYRRPRGRTVVGSNLGSTPIPSEPSRVKSSKGSLAKMWLASGEGRSSNGCYFSQGASCSSRPTAAARGHCLTLLECSAALAATGRWAIPAAQRERMILKWESRVHVGVAASHGRFEYLERSRRGIGSLPAQGPYPSCTQTSWTGEPSWSMLSVRTAICICTSIADRSYPCRLFIRLCLPAYPSTVLTGLLA